MRPNPYQGKFIVFEGLDGSGQGTQSQRLADFLTIQGWEVLLTKEPTPSSSSADEIRKALNKEIQIDAKGLQELFAQDRQEHLEKEIVPSLKRGKIVISDRYFWSSFAYGMAQGLKLSWLTELNGNFLMPDLTLLLKVKPEVCIQRVVERGKSLTLFERVEQLKKVRRNYELLATKFRSHIVVVDGEKSVNEVFLGVKAIVLTHPNLLKGVKHNEAS